jgi:hypothetical protein
MILKEKQFFVFIFFLLVASSTQFFYAFEPTENSDLISCCAEKDKLKDCCEHCAKDDMKCDGNCASNCSCSNNITVAQRGNHQISFEVYDDDSKIIDFYRRAYAYLFESNIDKPPISSFIA